MGFRVRHCVACPECGTRYLIGFSPYGNGSHLSQARPESEGEYKLVCTCCRPAVSSRWIRSDLKVYGVSRRAYKRGYGTPEEIRVLKPHPDFRPQTAHGLREGECL